MRYHIKKIDFLLHLTIAGGGRVCEKPEPVQSSDSGLLLP